VVLEIPTRVTQGIERLYREPEAVAFLTDKYPWDAGALLDASIGLEPYYNPSTKTEELGFLFPSYDEELEQWHYTWRQWKGTDGPKYKHDGPPYPDLYRPQRPGKPLWLCEGHPDTVTAIGLGFNASGLVGTSTVQRAAERLKAHKTVVTVMDADPSGWKATRALVSALIDAPNTQVQVALLIPPGEEGILWQPFKMLQEYICGLGIDLSDYVNMYKGAAARRALLNPISGPALLQFKNPPPPPPRLHQALDQDVGLILRTLACDKYCCQLALKRGAGNVHCPAHDDPSPSFSVKVEQGKVLVHCFGGCDQREVIQALIDRGLWRRGLESKPATSGSRSGASGYRSGTRLGWNRTPETRLSGGIRFPRA